MGHLLVQAEGPETSADVAAKLAGLAPEKVVLLPAESLDPGLVAGIAAADAPLAQGHGATPMPGVAAERMLELPPQGSRDETLQAWLAVHLPPRAMPNPKQARLEPLATADLAAGLAQLDPAWRVRIEIGRGAFGLTVILERVFRLGTYLEAARFALNAAELADEQDHHPELHHLWRTVTVRVTTTDAGYRLSARDIKLAASLDQRHRGTAEP